MKSIGGYFELELPDTKEYHGKAVRLNSGRAALQYVLLAKKVKHILLPFYICDSVVNSIKELNITISFYKINSNFSPLGLETTNSTDYILYVNYFGLCDENIKLLSKKYKNLIIDNSQAFYSLPLESHDCFYSPRKFFGVPDGGYLYTNSKLDRQLIKDKSLKKMRFLLERIENSAEQGYKYYLMNENQFEKSSLRNMSKLTLRILQSIDYNYIKKIRNENYLVLHRLLGRKNKLKISNNNLNGPLCYPFLSRNLGLKNVLIAKKIYIPTYWKEVSDRVDQNSFEWELTNLLLPLPIDQRYNTQDMQHLVNTINAYEEKTAIYRK